MRTADIEAELPAQLRRLRSERELSLDQLAALSGVSRATLSRLETGAVSPTTGVLAKLCPVYGLTMSRLIFLAESRGDQYLARDRQPAWRDPEIGFERRGVSPPTAGFSAEVLECVLDPGACLHYAEPPVSGLEHHLVVLAGGLRVILGADHHDLRVGDCLRYRLRGSSGFQNLGQNPTRYILVIL